MNPQDDPQKRPATKFVERHTQKKTHPENRPDIDAQPLDSSPSEPSAQPKRPDPNWQKGKYTKSHDKDEGLEGR
ncbi:MAG TPA: hypothetical protein VE981_20605 [Planctomycetota bacterium]|nr:hypothetical protein [Planctomycetota bacterium]